MFFSYWQDTNILCLVTSFSAHRKLWSLSYYILMICIDNFNYLTRRRLPKYAYKEWQIKDGHKFFDAPPIQEGWSLPFSLVLILGDLRDCSEQSDSAEMVLCQFSGPGCQRLTDSFPLECSCLGYSLSEHSCHAGRSPGHVGRPHIGAPVINPK